MVRLQLGGYVGDLQPGSVADALGETSILGGLVNTKETLVSLAEDFVPTIRNSSTTCIPCGGAVRADAASTTQVQRGMAGGMQDIMKVVASGETIQRIGKVKNIPNQQVLVKQ